MGNVLVLLGSKRHDGNTAILCESFLSGAKDAGHSAELINVSDLNINGCLGCMTCLKNGNRCVQQDDMQEIYAKIMAADAIVLATPVYCFAWSSWIKAVLDRTFAIVPIIRNKKVYMIAACADAEEEDENSIQDLYRRYVRCLDKSNEAAGYVVGHDSLDKGEVRKTKAVEQAYAMGNSIRL